MIEGNDMTGLNLTVKKIQCVKVKGDVPPELRGAEIDPDNPPDCVLEIVEIEGNNKKTVFNRRGQ